MAREQMRRSRVYQSRDYKDFAADNIQAVAADDSGRRWVASGLGVAMATTDDQGVWTVRYTTPGR